ncbi:hypothetical protein LP316_05770 [Thalassotalea sp. LPB0316]|uniref:hypothetical protein n=1 Tax=Thalassotalea sp. LPB0316 TaxID=2769490 RepID=UPI00186948D2|nr:hypothetical protein [Thalassotalea sp. LPB0316]QOL26804.1 hypothetical protein LP316_05770 [Thalassotalea sp. LPB0316]
MKLKFILTLCFAVNINACSSPSMSTEERVQAAVIGIITGSTIAYGNKAQCNHFKQKCGNDYREWQHKGKIACSC